MYESRFLGFPTGILKGAAHGESHFRVGINNHIGPRP